MTNRPDDPIPISPIHIADIWGKLEELENDVNTLKEAFREQHSMLELIVMLLKSRWPEKKE